MHVTSTKKKKTSRRSNTFVSSYALRIHLIRVPKNSAPFTGYINPKQERERMSVRSSSVLEAVQLQFKETPLKGQKFVLFACTLRDILEGRQRSCRLATLPCSTNGRGQREREKEKRVKKGETKEERKIKKKKRRKEGEPISCLFRFLLHPPGSLFPAAGFISTHSTRLIAQVLGATLIGPSNRRVSLLPLKGAKPRVRKTARPLSLRPLLLPSPVQRSLFGIRCIFQKIHECSKEGTSISAFVPGDRLCTLLALCARFRRTLGGGLRHRFSGLECPTWTARGFSRYSVFLVRPIFHTVVCGQ